MEMIRAKKETTDEGVEALEDSSDGFEALKMVPVHFFLPGSIATYRGKRQVSDRVALT